MADGHFGGGVGSIYDPFVIEDIQDFIAIQDIPDVDGDVYYVLANSIDLDPYIKEHGWDGMWIHYNTGSKILQGAGHVISITEQRENALFTSTHSINGFTFTIKNLGIQINSNTSSSSVILDSSNGSMILNHVNIAYKVSDVSKVLFDEAEVDCSYCKFRIYNDQDIKMVQTRYIQILNKVSLYRCIVDYGLNIVDQDFTISSTWQPIDMRMLPQLSRETVLSGSVIIDICTNFDDSYNLNPYTDAHVDLDIYIMDSCHDCYSTLYLNVRNYIAYKGTEYFGDELLLYTSLNVYMWECEQCYHNGEIYLMREDTETYMLGEFRIYNLYSGGEKFTHQYVNVDKLKVCSYNKHEDVYERIQEGYLTDTEMRSADYFTGFSFFKPSFPMTLGIWGISFSVNDGYPFLWWLELNYRLTLNIQLNNNKVNIPIKRLGFDKSDLIFSIQPFGDEHRAIHLVDIADSTALPIRIMTPDGIKAFSSKVFKYDFDMI